MDIFTLQDKLRKYRVRTSDEEQERLMEIGKELGYLSLDAHSLTFTFTQMRSRKDSNKISKIVISITDE